MLLLQLYFLLNFLSKFGRPAPPTCLNYLIKTEINSFTIMNGYVVTEERNKISIYKNISSGNPVLSFDNPIGQRLTKMIAIEKEILILCASNTIKLCSFTIAEGKFSCDKTYVNHKSTINDIVAIPFSTWILSCDNDSVHIWNALNISGLSPMPLANAKTLAVKNNETVYAIGEELFEISISKKTILLADKKYYKKTFQTNNPIYSLLAKGKLYVAQDNELTEFDFEKQSENTLTFVASNIIGNNLAYVAYQELLFYRTGNQISYQNGSFLNYSFFLYIGFENSSPVNLSMAGFDKYFYVLKNNILAEYNFSYWPVNTNEGCIPTCVLNKCRNCLSAINNICANCAPGFKNLNGVCLDSCPSGIDSETNDCCPKNCAGCQSNICNTCEPGYYLSFSAGDICKPCPGGCATCVTEKLCASCKSGYSLKISECIGSYNCSTNYFLNPLDNVCYKCSVLNCQACSKNITTCGACNSGYYLTNYSTCSSCGGGCINCSSSYKCNQCSFDYSLHPDGYCQSTDYNAFHEEEENPAGKIVGIVVGVLFFVFIIVCLCIVRYKRIQRLKNQIKNREQQEERERNNQSALPLNNFEQQPVDNTQNRVAYGEQNNYFMNNQYRQPAGGYSQQVFHPSPISTAQINQNFVPAQNTNLFTNNFGQQQLIHPQMVQNNNLPFVGQPAQPFGQQMFGHQPMNMGQIYNNQPGFGYNQRENPFFNLQPVGFIPEEK